MIRHVVVQAMAQTMTKKTKTSGSPGRLVLELLSAAPKRAIVGALTNGSMRPVYLSSELLISSATLYRHLAELEELGVIVKREGGSMPYAVEYSLTRPGREFGDVILQAERWLRLRCPLPLDPVSQSAWKAAIALGEGWEASILQQLVGRPLSESELVARLIGLSHYELCGRLKRLVAVGILQRIAIAGSKKSHYALSEWGRRGVGVLATSARWGGHHIPHQSAPARVENGIAALLVTLPLIRSVQPPDGLCELRVKEGKANVGSRDHAIWVDIRGGRCVRCGFGSPPGALTAWAHGSLADWLTAVLESWPAALRRGGDQRLINCVVAQLHCQLYSYEGLASPQQA